MSTRSIEDREEGNRVKIPAIVHIVGEDAIRGELDSFPDPTHQFLLIRNVTKKDGKALAYLADGAQTCLYAWHRITFVELMSDVSMPASMSGALEGASAAASSATPARTTVLGFFRDDES